MSSSRLCAGTASKPPRKLPGDLQTLPSFPWMFTWPMSAYERNRLCRLSFPDPVVCGQITEQPMPAMNYPYKHHWQFRNRPSDGTVHPDFLDLRGGPANLKDVTHYHPQPTPYPETMPGQKEVESESYILLKRQSDTVWRAWWEKYGEKFHYTSWDRENAH